MTGGWHWVGRGGFTTQGRASSKVMDVGDSWNQWNLASIDGGDLGKRKSSEYLGPGLGIWVHGRGNPAGGQVGGGRWTVALVYFWWTYAGSFAEFVFSIFFLFLKEGYVSVFRYVGIEQKKNGFLKS